MSEIAAETRAPQPELDPLGRTNLRFGWWSLAVFLLLGLALEGFHGLKLGFYLDLENATRRLMWTLAHAHGTLLSALVLGLVLTDRVLGDGQPGLRLLASRALRGAAILMPVGFFLGGLTVHSGDPGLGVLLVVPGALLAILAAVVTGLRAGR